MRKRRALVAIGSALLLGMIPVQGEILHLAYENAAAAIQRKLESGATVSLGIDLELAGFPAGAPSPAERHLLEAERATVLDRVVSGFKASPSFGFSGIDARIASSVDAIPQGVAAQSRRQRELDATLIAAKGPSLILIVSMVVLESRTGDLVETTARLLDRGTGKELSRDVVWTGISASRTSFVFINGWRMR